MTYTKSLSKLSKKDVAIAGGKGASLGELLQAKILVPNGFVVLTDAFDKFLDDTDLRQEVLAQLDKVDQDKMHTIERASERIQQMILRANMPKEIAEIISKDFSSLGAKYVAVRSSATEEDSNSAAWAGQLETYLNTKEEALLENVKKCWASLFTPRAIFYRFEKKLKESNISVAVVVQEMIESEKAGIAFSVHPVTQDKNQMIIEAIFGLGETIVSGTITPDSYVVSKKDNKIIDINIHEQTKALYKKDGGGNEWRDLDDKGTEQVLNEKAILKLAGIIKKIESHYNAPQDIEWAFANGKFFITQSRPITTLTRTSPVSSRALIDTKQYIYVANREITLLEMSLIIESYRHKYTEVNVLREFGKLLSDQAVIVGKGLSVDMYRTKESIKKAGDCSIALIKNDKLFLHNLADISIKIAGKIIRKIEGLKILISNENISQQQLKTFYMTWRELFLNFFPMQVLPLGFERSLEFNEKDILIKNKEVLINWRDKTQYVQMQLEKVFATFLGQTKKKLKKDIRYHSDMEVIQSLTKEKVFNKNDINLRENGYLMIWDFENEIPYSIYTGKEIIQTVSLLEKEKNIGDKPKNLMHGSGIGSGSCKAPAYILENKDDLNDVPQGCILVAKVLELEDIHKLKGKNICGVVTEEGGLTSHIAISGRELGVPIVVAVKNVTRLIQKDVLISIDADDGYITINNVK
ncbi:MAG: Phosphoenolpyruvate synthase [Candidatus Daviesbacteria bacterium GW2011_GWA2_38_24]|uniref:Phosphoenolpyruvate synthase n=1 Tax=Candidatus Daviesbacteria bacterium GW2011_GWA2_38_24 TaxID=1618422 RepID=A0A0G0LSK5_9BACT|nr:MAG: Phosphoenolpyruvate synthase [Candidatus Daviesbacteria bacterium GW2011_GWA2_38_24]